MTFAILSVFLLAALAPTLHRFLRGATGWVLALLPLGLSLCFWTLLPQVADGAIVESIPWVPSLGLALAFRIDGLSLLFLLLIAAIGALILVYAGAYLHGHRHEGRFFGFILFFMGSMLGLVASENLIVMFVFWELTSLASYLLIGFDHEQPKARASALQALLITGGGGLALLAGFILLGQVGGSYSFSELLQNGDAVREHTLYLPILLLVLAGAFTKSAQMPFHFWLPSAMAAPTPVSAYLHSATMVKAGVFLLARMNPLLGETVPWHNILTIVGVITMLGGALLALPQTDLKLLLAYSTVSALGALVLLLGIGTRLAMEAAIVYLFVHALYKAALFMVAGAIDHEAGTRDVRSLSGLIRIMPITAVAAGLAALSMSGFPPLLGFIGKELLYEAKVQSADIGLLVTGMGVLANVAMVAVALLVGFTPFHGILRKPSARGHEPPLALWLGPATLAGLSIVLGLFPQLIDQALVAPAVTAVRARETVVTLKMWHGINPVFLLSLATVFAGIAVYRFRSSVAQFGKWVRPVTSWGPERWYELGLVGLMRGADWQTRLLQGGKLRHYVFVVLAVSTGLAGIAITRKELAGLDFAGLRFHEVAAALLIFAAALVAARSRGRLSAVAALGVVGYGVALLYAMFGAPDLAMTQILVETLTLVLFVLVVYHLPRFETISPPGRRLFDAVFAGAAGVVITLLVLAALQSPQKRTVSDWLAQNSLRAEGRNVVNVILVDFRALDTFGEIVVLAVAALGVFALLRLWPRGEKGGGQ
ncbi:putative monovalent cation/H+ antiporter subunit A [soil metagenome]